MGRLLTKRRVVAALALFILFAAWNRGINLLYGMFALLAATAAAAHLFPLFALRGIGATRRHAATAFEGSRLAIRARLSNRSRSARHMIEVIDRIPAAPPGRESPMSFIGRIRGRRERRFEYDVLCDKRGEYTLGPLTLRSGFPLGLATRERTFDDSLTRLIVYPQIFPIASLPIRARGHSPMRGTEVIARAGGSDDFFGTREYHPGDSPRHIHWPSTARHRELIVKEFEIRAATEVTIVLDLHKNAHRGAGKENTLEYAVKIAASVASCALEEGHDVQLAGYGREPRVVPAGRGVAQLGRLLDVLARVQPDGDVRYWTAIMRAADLMRDGGCAFLFFSDDGQDPIGTAQAIVLLRARRIAPICVFIDRYSFGAADHGAPRDRPGAPGAHAMARLQADGVPCYQVKRGDVLERIFDPR